MPLQYVFEGKKWQTNKWEWLQDFLGVTADKMADLHRIASIPDPGWKIFSRFFGICTVPPTPEYSGVRWRMKEIREWLNIPIDQAKEELEVIKLAWMKRNPNPNIEPGFQLQKYENPTQYFQKNPNSTRPPAISRDSPPILYYDPTKDPVNPKYLKPRGEEAFIPPEVSKESVDVLTQFRFPRKMFSIANRSIEENESELNWFIGRVKNMEKILSDPRAETLCRQMLMKELDLERLRTALATTGLLDEQGKENKTYLSLKKALSESEQEYERQWEALNKACPMAAQIQSKARIAGVVSDLIQGIRDYQSDLNNETIDGIFTAHEIQVLCRQSVQAPVPQYRKGWVVSKQLSKIGLWDKNWNPKPNVDYELHRNLSNSSYAHGLFAKLDKSFKEAIEKVRIEMKIPLPDLRGDGKDNEYQDLEDCRKELGGNNEATDNQASEDMGRVLPGENEETETEQGGSVEPGSTEVGDEIQEGASDWETGESEETESVVI